MARPKPDQKATREVILNLAEAQLVKSDGRRLVLSDIARDMGVSQPYIHGYFPTKADLVRALAEQWFSLIEAEGEKVAKNDLPPEEKLHAYVSTIFRIKRDTYRANPELFAAYLSLAAQHMDIVRKHTDILSKQMTHCVSQLVTASRLRQSVELVEDVTVAFRNPNMIMIYHDSIDERRLTAVLDCAIDFLKR